MILFNSLDDRPYWAPYVLTAWYFSRFLLTRGGTFRWFLELYSWGIYWHLFPTAWITTRSCKARRKGKTKIKQFSLQFKMKPNKWAVSKILHLNSSWQGQYWIVGAGRRCICNARHKNLLDFAASPSLLIPSIVDLPSAASCRSEESHTRGHTRPQQDRGGGLALRLPWDTMPNRHAPGNCTLFPLGRQTNSDPEPNSRSPFRSCRCTEKLSASLKAILHQVWCGNQYWRCSLLGITGISYTRSVLQG